ncbi:hypothetical protein FB45DRAFT_713190, partial [Roridomyces roridus]
GRPHGTTGFGLFWGENNGRNVSCRIEQGSESRAALAAVHCAILAVPDDTPLTIYTSSEYAIRSYCYWAGDYAVGGWTCTHGDVLQAAAASILRRSAPVHFYLTVRGGNKHAEGARTLAHAAAA